MKQIKTVHFITNGYGAAEDFVEVVKKTIKKEKIKVEVVDDSLADLVIILGGDGTVLNAVRKTGFSHKTVYFSVNFGDKGFLTNVQKDNALEIITDILKNAENYDIQKINVLEIDIEYSNGSKHRQYALNELWLKGEKDRPIQFKQYSSEGLLQKFTATGLIIATSSGSTAAAMSAGGPVIINGDVMLSAINMASEVGTEDRYFRNPIIDTNMTIGFLTKKEFKKDQRKKGNYRDGKYLYEHSKYKLCIEVDSVELQEIYPEEIKKIEVKLSKRLQFIKLKDESRTSKMRECILKIKDK